MKAIPRRALNALACLLVALPALPVLAADYVYVHSRRTAEIYAFEIDRRGRLTTVPGSPFDTGLSNGRCGGYCQALAWSKHGNTLVVPGLDAVASLVVAEDGTLAHAPGSPWEMEGEFLGAATLKRGRFAYVNDFDTGDVHAFAVGRDGALTPLDGSPYATGGPGIVGMTGAGGVIVSVNQIDASLVAFRLGRRGSLRLGPNSPLPLASPSDTFIFNANLDPRGRHVYVGDCGPSDQIFAVEVRRSAELMPLEASPYDTDLEEVCGGVAISDRRRAIAIENDDEAQVLRRDPREGTLELMTAPQQLAGGDSHALSRKGDLLVVADDGNDTLTSYALDRASGALTQRDQASIGGARDANETLLIRR